MLTLAARQHGVTAACAFAAGVATWCGPPARTTPRHSDRWRQCQLCVRSRTIGLQVGSFGTRFPSTTPSAATGVVRTAAARGVAHGRARGHRQCSAVPARSWSWRGLTGRQYHEQRRPLPQLPLTATRLRRRSPGLDPCADTRWGWRDTAAAVTRVREQHDVASHTHVATNHRRDQHVTVRRS